MGGRRRGLPLDAGDVVLGLTTLVPLRGLISAAGVDGLTAWTKSVPLRGWVEGVWEGITESAFRNPFSGSL